MLDAPLVEIALGVKDESYVVVKDLDMVNWIYAQFVTERFISRGDHIVDNSREFVARERGRRGQGESPLSFYWS